jgi:hypothetical protein
MASIPSVPAQAATTTTAPKQRIGVSMPSLKLVMDFFHATPDLQKLYAKHVVAMMQAYLSGTITQYPAQLNTNGDIADFVIKNRTIQVNAGESLAEAFLTMHISASPKRKNKGEDRPKPDVKVPKVSPKVSSKPEKQVKQAASTRTPLRERAKRELSVPLHAIPTALKFFASSRQSVFSSNGGLHDVSCQLCSEIGFYNVLRTGRRGLSLRQKRWTEVLHEVLLPDGKTVLDESKLEDCGVYPDGGVSAVDIAIGDGEVATSWGDSMEDA